ncbi:MAG: hypothetical protein SFV51_01540 [Bryobacteraceae bacterium]|nr:hypothetical protein [Bryobacteraceae bacterium]
MPGQPQLGTNPLGVGINCTPVTLASAGLPNNLVIGMGDSFTVSTQVVLDGLLANAALSIPLNYSAEFFYEGMGSAAGEGSLAPAATGSTAAHAPGPLAGQRNFVITSTPTTPGAQGMTPGVYEVSVVVTFTGPGGPWPITCFATGPVIQVSAVV